MSLELVVDNTKHNEVKNCLDNASKINPKDPLIAAAYAQWEFKN